MKRLTSIVALLCATACLTTATPSPSPSNPPRERWQPPPDWVAPAKSTATKPHLPADQPACLPEATSWPLADAWQAWRRARLEEELTRKGWILLAPARMSFSAPPSVHFLAVERTAVGCAPSSVADYAMDEAHKVHKLLPDFSTPKSVFANICGCARGQCGGAARPSGVIYVSAPEGATLAEPVAVTVSLEENAYFTGIGPCQPMP